MNIYTFQLIFMKSSAYARHKAKTFFPYFCTFTWQSAISNTILHNERNIHVGATNITQMSQVHKSFVQFEFNL